MQQSFSELLIVLLDARLVVLEEKVFDVAESSISARPLFPDIWESLLVFFRAHFCLGQDQQLAVFVVSANGCRLCSGSTCQEIDFEALKKTVVKFALEPCSFNGLPMMSSAVSSALCFAHLRKSDSLRGLDIRLLIIDASVSEVVHSSQSSGLVSCGFAAKANGVPIDCLSLGQKASSVLRQVCILTGGKHHVFPKEQQFRTPKGDVLPLSEVIGPALLFHFLPGVAVRKELSVAADVQHLPVVCACHGQPQEIGQVCSCCLAVLCSDRPAICPFCKTRFKRDRDPDRHIRDVGPEEALFGMSH